MFTCVTQPLLQQRLQLAHVLKAQLQGLKAANGRLAEHLTYVNIHHMIINQESLTSVSHTCRLVAPFVNAVGSRNYTFNKKFSRFKNGLPCSIII